MPVLELVKFTAKSNKSFREIIKAANKSTLFLKKQPGFMSRYIHKGENYWTDCVNWATLESAKMAAEKFSKAPECIDFMSLIDKVENMEHLTEENSLLKQETVISHYLQKKYFIVFDTRAYKVNWENLFDPENYELIIMTEADCYKHLQEDDQLPYFSNSIQLDNLNFSTYQVSFKQIIDNLKAIGIQNEQIQILNNDELCMLKCARLRKEFDLVGPTEEQLMPFRDKVAAKRKMKGLEKYLPKYIPFDGKAYYSNPEKYAEQIADNLGFPIFAKPIDLAGSVGSSKIHNMGELKRWCELQKNNPHMELDEFIQGTLYHCDSFVKDGKILRIDIAKYIYPMADFLSGKPQGSIELLESDPDWSEITKFNTKMLQCLQPPDGATHLELFKTNKGDLIFLECAARTPGALIPEMRQIATGVNCHVNHYKLQMGLNVDLQGARGPYGAWGCIPRLNGVLEETYEPKGILSKCQMVWKNKPGDLLKKSEDIAEYAFSLILHNSDYAQLQKDFQILDTHNFYKVGKTFSLAPDAQFFETSSSNQAKQTKSESAELSSDPNKSNTELQWVFRKIING